ncbi:MAG: hypothetical protein FJ150_02670 [Euryarchaeota archaeon]|nr:hypothetical protein [Euryarchaeota archaeon]
MARFNKDILISQTTVGGTISWETPRLFSGVIRQVLVKANTNSTTFNFDITDENNNIIYSPSALAVGTLREEMAIPAIGILTLRIYNASADELFTGRIAFQEE